MNHLIALEVRKQPDELTCGPTCLYSMYQFYGEKWDLEKIVSEVSMLDEGGTLAANLGVHALSNNFQAELYTYNLAIFDPTWLNLPKRSILKKLKEQAKGKALDAKLLKGRQAYMQYLEKGGQLKFKDLNRKLLEKHLSQNQPIIAGLSATYLYRSCRENPVTNQFEDVMGYPSGHFVVLTGIDLKRNRIILSDPLQPNPLSPHAVYDADIDHLICAILLGVVTYDANLLIITPSKKTKRTKIQKG